ncbi:MAG: tyrosine-type recombinase/integrase [Parvularculaceae bacterium]|nr:tyrosine-type recombinase/integrase [Parvularculaceae bacterium]
MPKRCEENERMKRRYLQWLEEAEGRNRATTDKVAAALDRFEQSTGRKPFRAFHIGQAVAFKRKLTSAKNHNGTPLSKATVSATVRAVKAFFKWLSQQSGYKSRISLADCSYFNLPAKDEAIAHARREAAFPSLDQALHAFRQMPEGDDIERRNKALFAFLLLTGARVSAVASLKLKHVDLGAGLVFQDAREVDTKASKTIYTTLFPVDAGARGSFDAWVARLNGPLLFGPTDPLFPKTAIRTEPGRGFRADGFARAHWTTAAPIREIVGEAFERAGLPRFGPHSFRKTLTHWGSTRYTTPEAFKAFSQNLGHESVLTTFTSYGEVSWSRQAEIIKAG